MHKPAPLYAARAKHAPAHIARWEDAEFASPARLLRGLRYALPLAAGLWLLLASCVSTASRALRQEHPTPTASHRTK